MTVADMQRVCEEAGVLSEDLKYLQGTGLLVGDLRIPGDLKNRIIENIDKELVDGFRTAHGHIITALGMIQKKDTLLKYEDVLVPGLGRLSDVDS